MELPPEIKKIILRMVHEMNQIIAERRFYVQIWYNMVLKNG